MSHTRSVIKPYLMTCQNEIDDGQICGFSTYDQALMDRHSCDVQSFGGRCEDYPCCGHEAGDCNGQLYGSDEAIKEDAYAHAYCDHENGHCEAWEDYDDDVD